MTEHDSPERLQNELMNNRLTRRDLAIIPMNSEHLQACIELKKSVFPPAKNTMGR